MYAPLTHLSESELTLITLLMVATDLGKMLGFEAYGQERILDTFGAKRWFY